MTPPKSGAAHPAGTSTVTAPLPVRWDESRAARGARTAPRTPRCPVPACPVRYASGADRVCREHARESETDTRSLALARAAPARHRNWPKVSDLTPAQRAELDSGSRSKGR
jgi:hypothetical protein